VAASAWATRAQHLPLLQGFESGYRTQNASISPKLAVFTLIYLMTFFSTSTTGRRSPSAWLIMLSREIAVLMRYYLISFYWANWLLS
jgi:hypothetical protein